MHAATIEVLQGYEQFVSLIPVFPEPAFIKSEPMRFQFPKGPGGDPSVSKLTQANLSWRVMSRVGGACNRMPNPQEFNNPKSKNEKQDEQQRCACYSNVTRTLTDPGR